MTCPRCHRQAHDGRCQPAESQASLLPPLPDWRVELQHRVESYRSRRRPRGEDQAVDVGEPRVLTFRPESTGIEVLRRASSAEPVELEPLADPVVPATRPREEDTRELAPRLIMLPENPPTPIPEWPCLSEPEGIAEPVRLRTPRRHTELVREVTALPSEAAAFLQIPLPMTSPPAAAVSAPGMAVAPRPERLRAGMVDIGIVGLAAVLFGFAGWASQGFPAPEAHWVRHLLPALVLTPALLGALYLAACGWLGGVTVGMERAGLTLASLDGTLTPEARRRRGWASLVSLAALGMGYAWIFCDSQQLTWHDYISRTYVTRTHDTAEAAIEEP